MGRRIRWLALGMVVLFALVLAQLVNIQQREASSLNADRTNPRNLHRGTDNMRGLILAADNQVLARSVKMPAGADTTRHYYRSYPTGSTFSALVGFTTLFDTSSGIEHVYSNYLSLHTQPVQSLGQLLNPPKPTTDNVTLNVLPPLQKDARAELTSVPGTNRDGAIVVESVTTGDILAMYSNPTYTNNVLSTPDVGTKTFTKEKQAWIAYTQTPDKEGFLAWPPLAYWDPLLPGSTFKVVTSTAVYNLKPTLAGFTFKVSACTGKGVIVGFNKTQQICNDATTASAANPCGGTLKKLLPESCDPAYAMLGVHVGATAMYQQATLFGYDAKPPIDLYPVSQSNFPTVKVFRPTTKGPAELALVSFGQGTVAATALQNAMVAQAIADTGRLMTPNVASRINNSATGALVKAITPTLYKQAASAAAAQSVNKLMQLVATSGTAAGVGFPPTEKVAVKTGTAQEGDHENVDWMIGFAPATAPRVAISVVVPRQPSGTAGATVAGPIFKAMVADALAAVAPRTTSPATTTPITGPVVATTTGTSGTTTTTIPTAQIAPTTTEPTAPPVTTTTTAPNTTTTTGAAAPPATTPTTHPPPPTTPSTTGTATTAALRRSRPPTPHARTLRAARRWRWASMVDA